MACLKVADAEDDGVADGGASGKAGKGVCVFFGREDGREESTEAAANVAAIGLAGNEGCR